MDSGTIGSETVHPMVEYQNLVILFICLSQFLIPEKPQVIQSRRCFNKISPKATHIRATSMSSFFVRSVQVFNTVAHNHLLLCVEHCSLHTYGFRGSQESYGGEIFEVLSNKLNLLSLRGLSLGRWWCSKTPFLIEKRASLGVNACPPWTRRAKQMAREIMVTYLGYFTDRCPQRA